MVEKRVSVQQNAAISLFSYTDSAKMPPQPPAAALVKSVVNRLYREVTVETINDTAPKQQSPQVVNAIKKARTVKPGKVIAARCFPCRDIQVTADSSSRKALLEKENE